MSSSISTRLQYQHKSMLDIIDEISDEQARIHIHPGKWSIFEHMVHLQTYQHVFINRVRQILSAHNPHFPVYTAEADPFFLDNCHLSSREIMQDLLTTRKEMAAELIGFPSEDLEKTGIHPHFGQMNLLQWSNFFLLHEAHHLFTIFKLAAMIKKQPEA